MVRSVRTRGTPVPCPPPYGDRELTRLFSNSSRSESMPPLPVELVHVILAIGPPRLKAVHRQCPLNPPKIKIVRAKNLQVAQFIPESQLVVSLELVPMPGGAHALKVFAAVL